MQDNQFAAVRRFILEGVDFIIIAPTVEEGWDTVLTEVHDAGIPVIVMDRSVAVENDDLYLTNIGSDFLHQGNLAVEWLESEIPEDKEIRILPSLAEFEYDPAYDGKVCVSIWRFDDYKEGVYVDENGDPWELA